MDLEANVLEGFGAAPGARLGIVVRSGVSSPPAIRWPTGLPGTRGDLGVMPLITIGHERDIDQDPGFGIRQLIDIALRAISPGINDPTTAVPALHARAGRTAGRPRSTADLPEHGGGRGGECSAVDVRRLSGAAHRDRPLPDHGCARDRVDGGGLGGSGKQEQRGRCRGSLPIGGRPGREPDRAGARRRGRRSRSAGHPGRGRTLPGRPGGTRSDRVTGRPSGPLIV